MRKAAVILSLLALAVRAEAQETKPTEQPAAPAAAPAEAAPAPAPAPAPEKKPITFVLSDKSKITITGRAWAAAESVRATDPLMRSYFRVTNNASFLRFRGEYAVSDALTAFAQIESEFSIDGQAATPFNSGRNTGVGFTGRFGTAFLGRWDSPYKESTGRLDPYLGTGVAGYYNVMGQMPTAANASANLWDSRLTNGAQYWTPKIGGLQLRAAVAVGERRANPHVYSFSASYEGPLYLTAAYEVRYSCAGADDQASPQCTQAALSGVGKDQGFRLGAGYNSKPTLTQLGAAFERLDYHSDATATVGVKSEHRNAFFFSLIQGLGTNTHQLVGTLGLAGPIGGSNNAFGDGSNTRSTYYTLGYWYNFTKDLRLFATYVKQINSLRVPYKFGSRGYTVAAGQDPDAVTTGVYFLF